MSIFFEANALIEAQKSSIGDEKSSIEDTESFLKDD